MQRSFCRGTSKFALIARKRSPSRQTTLLRSVRPREVTSMMRNVKYRANYESVAKLSQQIQKECTELNLTNVSSEELLRLSKEAKLNFTDYTYIRKFQCALMAILSSVQRTEIANTEGIPVLDMIVEDYFNPIQKFGRESANGAAYKVGWEGVEEWISVMKIAKGSAKEDADLFHELAVGLALNKLRAEVPYFMYVWGGFYCERPKNTQLSCHSEDKDKITTLALFELIYGKELDEWMKSGEMTPNECIEVVLQVAYAIYLAQKNFKFMHFDLHGGNVLVRKLPQKVTFELKLTNGDIIKIKTKFIPQLIDYGMSSMLIDQKFVTSKFYDAVKTPKNVMQLQGSRRDYFYSLYDIWRYVSFEIGEFHIKKVSNFDKLWRTLITPFFEMAKEAFTPEQLQQPQTGLQECFAQTNMKKAIDLILTNPVSRDLEFEDIPFIEMSVETYIRKLIGVFSLENEKKKPV